MATARANIRKNYVNANSKHARKPKAKDFFGPAEREMIDELIKIKADSGLDVSLWAENYRQYPRAAQIVDLLVVKLKKMVDIIVDNMFSTLPNRESLKANAWQKSFEILLKLENPKSGKKINAFGYFFFSIQNLMTDEGRRLQSECSRVAYIEDKRLTFQWATNEPLDIIVRSEQIDSAATGELSSLAFFELIDSLMSRVQARYRPVLLQIFENTNIANENLDAPSDRYLRELVSACAQKMDVGQSYARGLVRKIIKDVAAEYTQTYRVRLQYLKSLDNDELATRFVIHLNRDAKPGSEGAKIQKVARVFSHAATANIRFKSKAHCIKWLSERLPNHMEYIPNFIREKNKVIEDLIWARVERTSFCGSVSIVK